MAAMKRAQAGAPELNRSALDHSELAGDTYLRCVVLISSV
jgi:hypothetical protein